MKLTGQFTGQERKAIFSLGAVISSRMLGLSMIIPVFSLYASGLPGSSPLLAGLAFGAYGLTQAVFQIPFGYYSDRLGRRPVVAAGLALFGAGSVICAMTSNIYLLIAGRFLQGGGAIASACFAWIADLTSPSRRTIAMAVMGIAVGGGITGGMIVGPMLGAAAGVPFLFWLAAGLSLFGLLITLLLVKEPPEDPNRPRDFSLNPLEAMRLAATGDLLRLHVTGLIVNMCMICTFYVVPLRINHRFPMNELWKIYLPLAVVSGMAMMLSSRHADRGAGRKVISGAALALAAAFLTLTLAGDVRATLPGFALFFMGFSVLEASLPAAVSKLADPAHKGTIIGVFNLFQFSGTFFGGLLAGFLAPVSEPALFAMMTVIALAAAYFAWGVRGLNHIPASA
ncbi:MAG: MFS transporter [Nitrospinae bacterium]|nr:MFS transporter [Nitrospinota bacterium]